MPAKKPRRKPQRRTYVPRPNAVHITIYSQDGRPVPKSVLNEAAQSVTNIALENNLLIGLAET
jgi:hypothetical protein